MLLLRFVFACLVLPLPNRLQTHGFRSTEGVSITNTTPFINNNITGTINTTIFNVSSNINGTIFGTPPAYPSEVSSVVDDMPPPEIFTVLPDLPMIPAEFDDDEELIILQQSGQAPNNSAINGNSSNSGDGANDACAVTLNARNDLCGAYLYQLSRETSDRELESCDCYNFCNGKLIGCFSFDTRITFACTGELSAGCLKKQLQYHGNGNDNSYMDTGTSSAHKSQYAMGMLLAGFWWQTLTYSL